MDHATLARLADNLTPLMDRPVVDRTGITGEFDFEIKFGGSAPSIARTLQRQYGLTLEPRKVEMEVLTVKSARKTPE